MAICYVFFIPFFKHKLIHKDTRVAVWHIPLGPLLLCENPPLYFPKKGDQYVKNYYADAYGEVPAGTKHDDTVRHRNPSNGTDGNTPSDFLKARQPGTDTIFPSNPEKVTEDSSAVALVKRLRKPEPYDRSIVPIKHRSWVSPQKWWGYLKFGLLQGQQPSFKGRFFPKLTYVRCDS
jgi:hypothetical protein